MGAVSPIGNTADEMWQSAKAGVCGIDYITAFDTENFKVKIAGEVKNLDLTQHFDKMTIRRSARFTQLATIAAREAMADSGLNIAEEDAFRCGVNVSTGIGGLPTIEAEHSRGLEKSFDRVSPLFVPMAITNMAAGLLAIEFGLKGSATCVVTACASATNAIGEAMRQIRDGYADIMVTGGTESCVSELGIGGFTSMKALTESTDPKRASIPFDKERDGFVLGEGAGILVLEEYEHAKARGAKIYAEVCGYGLSCDAHHMTAPLEDGSGAAAAMSNAIADAGLTPADIDYINAHGTSTPMNDKGETAAVKLAFGEAAKSVAMSSTKSMTGHLLGASGGIEAIMAVKAIEDKFIPPTIGYKVPDELCDLDIVPLVGREADLKYTMSNSLGFGGHNASLVFGRV